MDNVGKFHKLLTAFQKELETPLGLDLTSIVSTSHTWDEVEVLLRETIAGRSIYLTEAAVSRLLTREDVEFLEHEQLVLERGKWLTVNLNGTRHQRCLGVDFDKLHTRAYPEQAALIQHRDAAVLEMFFQTLERDREIYETVPSVELPEAALADPTKGVPVLFLSGLHWDEVVKPDDTQFVEEYDRSIASGRLKRVFRETLERLQPQSEEANYDGIVCALGGDFLSGPTPAIEDIQGQATVAENVFTLVNELVSGLTQLAAMFAEVIVPCVAGNSGLTVPAGPTQAQPKVSGTMDYVLYRLLQKQMKNVRNIQFVISETPELSFSTYQCRYTMASQAYLQASGRFAPQMDKLSSQSRNEIRRPQPTDEYLLVSDGDEYRVVDNIVVNGSLRGPATASATKLATTASTQALWVGHPVHGVYLHQALKGDAPVIDEVEFPPISYSVTATRKANQEAFH